MPFMERHSNCGAPARAPGASRRQRHERRSASAPIRLMRSLPLFVHFMTSGGTMMIYRRCTSAAFLLALVSLSLSAQPSRFEGTWKLMPEKSSEIGLYGTLGLDIHVDG